MKNNTTNIKMSPYIGDNYKYGFYLNEDNKIVLGDNNNLGYKVLFLNEIFYVDPDYFNNSWIKDMFDYYFKRHKQPFPTFDKTAKALCYDIAPINVWKHLMFHNYIQEYAFEIFHCPGYPIPEEYYLKSENAFMEILETYKPDIVICNGKRLYYKLPIQNGKQGPDIEIQNGKYDSETWIYKIKDKNIIIIPMTNASSISFCPNNWNLIFVELFKLLQNETY